MAAGSSAPELFTSLAATGVTSGRGNRYDSWKCGFQHSNHHIAECVVLWSEASNATRLETPNEGLYILRILDNHVHRLQLGWTVHDIRGDPNATTLRQLHSIDVRE